MSKPTPRQYRERTRIRLYRRADPSMPDALDVRYTVESRATEISGMIRRAAHNKTGRCTAGPVTIFIHPDDHAAVQAATKGSV
jgi:hypothetical protein